jgi:hypothetical protein
MRAWIGRGDSPVIRESTGWEFPLLGETNRFPQREAKGLRPKPDP